ncbi:MAG: AAA family ATPase [Bacilli bacterium]
MKLTFEKIEYKNIMSVGAKPVVIDLMSNKKTLITGKNGGGKSTMLEALCFVLYGKPFRSIKKGQLLNTINKKALLVDLDFNDGKHQYHIKRGIKPNVFEITRDGQEIPELAAVKDFQTMFETDIIKMTIQSFKQTIVLGTAGYTPFMQLTAANRRVLIEDLINLTVYSKMDVLNKAVVKEIKQQMDALVIKLDGLQSEHAAHMNHIKRQEQMSGDHIAQLQSLYDNHVEKATSIKTELLALQSQLADVVMSTDYSAEIKKCMTAFTIIGTKLHQAAQTMKFFSDNCTCPTCKQEIDETYKSGIVSGLSQESETLKNKQTLAKQHESKYIDLQQAFTKQQQELAALSAQINGKKGLIASEVYNANSMKAKIEQAKNVPAVDRSRVDELDAEMEAKRVEKSEMFEEMYARKIVLNMLKDSGIKATVMKMYMPVINQKVNHYLTVMGADYTFTLDSEFNEVIKSRGREDFSYESFSQGEKARIDLSLMFTWRDVASVVSGTEINLLILDEIADGATDGEGVKSIHGILDGAKGNMFVISHREEHDKNLFDHHIRMIKKGRFSVMDE